MIKLTKKQAELISYCVYNADDDIFLFSIDNIRIMRNHLDKKLNKINAIVIVLDNDEKEKLQKLLFLKNIKLLQFNYREYFCLVNNKKQLNSVVECYIMVTKELHFANEDDEKITKEEFFENIRF